MCIPQMKFLEGYELPLLHFQGQSRVASCNSVNSDVALESGSTQCGNACFPVLTGVIVPANLGALSAPGNCHCILMC